MNKIALFVVILALVMTTGCKTARQQEGVSTTEPVKVVEVEVVPSNTQPEQNEGTTEGTTEAVIVPEEINYQEVRPYEIGHIMVVMYHGIEAERPPYQRAEADFVKDLQYLYDHGYRLISMSDYRDSHIDIPAGYTPVVLTFDDGLSTTFSLEEVDGKLVPKKGTAVALLEAFAKEHPDFGKEASFYINGDNGAFNGAGTLSERLQWLVENGYEVGNHTYSHPDLSKLSGDLVQEEIGKVDVLIKEALPGSTLDVLTYPFGIRPDEAYRNFVIDGLYSNQNYHYSIGFREGPSGAMVAPLHTAFEPYNCPRVRGSEGKEGDLWWWLAYYEEHPDYLFKSDGNPDQIAVPKENEEKVNKDQLGQKTLFLY